MNPADGATSDGLYGDDWNSKLVKEVEKHPCLYNPALPKYSDNQYCQLAWQKIAKIMNDTVPTCRDKWRNIRGAFVRNVNLEPGRRRARRPYYMYERLQFLLPHINRKEKRSDLSDVFEIEYETGESSEESDLDPLSSNERKEKRKFSIASPKTSGGVKKMRTAHNSSTIEHRHPNDDLEYGQETSFSREIKPPLDTRLKPTTRTAQEDVRETKEDAFDLFGKYVATQLREMSTRQSVLLQMEIQKAIAQVILSGLPNGNDMASSSSLPTYMEITPKCENLSDDIDHEYVKIATE